VATEYFSPNKRSKDKFDYQCRECKAAYSRGYYQTDRGKEFHRIRNIKSYGITPKQHIKMYVDQNGCCGICGEAIPYSKVYIDHDHKTDKVRGLLCITCNLQLGILEMEEFVNRAKAYLSRVIKLK